MGAKTGIEWTDATWNPIMGCSRVSEGCRHCYAEGVAARFGLKKNGAEKKPTVYDGLIHIVNGEPVWTGKIVETRQLLTPLKWRKPKRIFVNSMSDLFHENVTDEQRDRIFAVMALCPQHTFQVLTKRPAIMHRYLSDSETSLRVQDCVDEMTDSYAYVEPFPNLWLGVSVENQAAADERIPLLLQTPAAVRFLSCEPLLGPLLIEGALHNLPEFDDVPQLPRIDWVICGGESGPHARPMHPDWARSLRDQCAAAGVSFFFKQWGQWTPTADPKIAADRGISLKDCLSWHAKKADAGSLLDGIEHKAFPEVHA